MSLPDDIEQKFFVGERTERVRFALNDSVRVKSGPHVGRTAAVVSITRMDPEPVFILEPGEPPWGDLEVPQSNLELVDKESLKNLPNEMN